MSVGVSVAGVLLCQRCAMWTATRALMSDAGLEFVRALASWPSEPAPSLFLSVRCAASWPGRLWRRAWFWRPFSCGFRFGLSNRRRTCRASRSYVGLSLPRALAEPECGALAFSSSGVPVDAVGIASLVGRCPLPASRKRTPLGHPCVVALPVALFLHPLSTKGL